MTTTLRGCALLDGSIATAEIDIEGDRISAIRTLPPEQPEHPATPGAIPVSGTMTAAYVDMHCHGGGGTAFTDLDPEAAAATARHHHSRGSTSLVASLVSMTAADLERGVAILADLADDGLIDGIHLEGPWLAKARCGAHDPALLRDPDLAEVERLLALGRGHIRQVTLAPERDHGLDLVGWLTSAGVHAAVGHTTASYVQVRQAVEAGADIATHLFNGMDPWHHRNPGAVPALLRAAARDGLTLELIADGAHLSDDTVRTVLDLVGPGHVAFVSDAMAAAGIGDGPYVLGGLAVVVTDGTARLQTAPGEPPGSIAGGTSHIADIVARVVASGLPLPYAAQSATVTPARLLGLDDRGVLTVGARADLLVLGDFARVTRVMRAGQWLGDATVLSTTSSITASTETLSPAGEPRATAGPLGARWPVAIFDLDGTLADTVELIVASYQHAFRTVIGREEDPEVIKSWIGRPLIRAFRDHSPEHADELYETFLRWNTDNTERLIRGFEGVVEVLAAVRAAGVRVAVATSKRRESAQQAMDILGLNEHVEVLVGMEDTEIHKPDPAPLLLALSRLGEGDPSRAVYVGDAVVDALAGKAAGMSTVCVTWGAGTREALAAVRPDATADTASELERVLLPAAPAD